MPEQPITPSPNPERPPLPSVEKQGQPEALPEQRREQEWQPDFLEQAETPAQAPPSAPAQASPVTPVTPPRSLFEREVEFVLSEGLDQTYQQLDPATQQRFKTVGEQTAATIAGLLEQAKVQSKKILDLIVSWLRIIPGVNKFFLEQEAKIKTDKLLALRRPHQT